MNRPSNSRKKRQASRKKKQAARERKPAPAPTVQEIVGMYGTPEGVVVKVVGFAGRDGTVEIPFILRLSPQRDTVVYCLMSDAANDLMRHAELSEMELRASHDPITEIKSSNKKNIQLYMDANPAAYAIYSVANMLIEIARRVSGNDQFTEIEERIQAALLVLNGRDRTSTLKYLVKIATNAIQRVEDETPPHELN